MDKDIIVMLYNAFLDSLLVKCVQYSGMYEITYIEDGQYITDIFISFIDNKVTVSVSQSVPRYPVYDSQGNIINFSV